LRIHAEELDSRVEPLLAGSLRRSTHLASNAVLALAGPAVGVLMAGTVMGAVVSAGDVGAGSGDVLLQSAATIPAVWVIVALGLAVVGARPALRLAAWLGVVGSFALTLFGPTFSLPGWALGISPFAHVPNVTVASPDWWGLVVDGLVALALTAVAFAGFRRRDIG
jgi:ABC-2 type transport system permease protein